MWQPTINSSYLCHSFWAPTDELYHHGILGMKWGKRNGPPYPLDASDHSTSEKKAGWKKSLGGGGTKSKKPVKDKFVYTFAGLQKDHDNGKELSENDYRKLVKYRLDETDKKYPGFNNWLEDNNYSNKYDPKTDIHNKFLDMYKKEINSPQKEVRTYNDITAKYKNNHRWYGFLEGAEEKIAKETMLKDKEHIAEHITNVAVKNLERWAKEEGKDLKIDNKKKSKMLKQIKNNLDNSSEFYLFNDGTMNFNINGLKEYSNGHPLTVDYNPETKKVSFDYV